MAVTFIAEIGVNHNGDLGAGAELIRLAADAGADAVKFQTWQFGHFPEIEALRLPWDDHEWLREEALDAGVEFLSTAFDVPSLDFLVEFGVTRLKIGSGQLTDRALLKAAADSGLPLILSTGMSTRAEVRAAVVYVETQRGTPYRQEFAGILHCTSAYPAPEESVNLAAMSELRCLGYPVGYSDHTAGIGAAPYAVAAGATIIEKHITLDPAQEGPDHAASLGPDDLRACIAEVRRVETMMGSPEKAVQPCEQALRDSIRNPETS